jgi:DNA-binding response OmpR family regulator
MNGFKVGADDYITKPSTSGLLMARVAAQTAALHKYDSLPTLPKSPVDPPAEDAFIWAAREV